MFLFLQKGHKFFKKELSKMLWMFSGLARRRWTILRFLCCAFAWIPWGNLALQGAPFQTSSYFYLSCTNKESESIVKIHFRIPFPKKAISIKAVNVKKSEQELAEEADLLDTMLSSIIELLEGKGVLNQEEWETQIKKNVKIVA